MRGNDQADDIAIADAGGKHHRASDDEDRNGGSQIGLDEHEPDDAAGREADRQQRVRELVDALHSTFEERGSKENDGDLRQLGWLDAERAEQHPSPRAVHLLRKEDSDQRERHDAKPRPDDDRLPVRAVVDPHHDRHQRQADEHPRRLLEEEAVWGLPPLGRDDC